MPGTVTVGCKLPHGLHLRVFRMEKRLVPVMGGGAREVEEAVPAGRITIQGTRRRIDDPRIVYGYALTHGVDADVWSEWLAQNKDSELVLKGLVFAHVKHTEAETTARANENVRSGFDPIDPKSLPPEFKGKIETATALVARN